MQPVATPIRTALALAVSLVGAATAASCAPGVGRSESDYTASAFQGVCDGLPRLKVETPAGVCVGLAASGFKFARGIAQLTSGDLVVADMGGWDTNQGSIYRLSRKSDGTFAKKRLFTQIDKPSGIRIGPDGLVYVGTPKNIFRFDPDEQPVPHLKVVIDDLPSDGRHPLKHFVFDKQDPRSVYVNVGSGSDVCETAGAFPDPCPESDGVNPRGAIRKYRLDGPDHLGTTFETIATGLRNSMALAVHPASNLLLQGENGRDSINKLAPELDDAQLPHEELNVITKGANYGWPYCFDNGTPNPEYPNADCSKFQTPAQLLPPHVAPLGMDYYFGGLLPDAYRGNLLIAFHGYRELGHRIVMVPADSNGVPNGEPLDLVRGWEKTDAMPQGSPVAVLVASDGSIYVTEDKNGTVLRISYDPSKGDGAPLKPKPPKQPTTSPEEQARCAALASKTDEFSAVERDVIDVACASCHGVGPGYPGNLPLLKCDDVDNAEHLLAPRSTGGPLVTPYDPNSELLLRLKGDGFPQMPAGGVSPGQLDEVTSWIMDGAPVPQ